MPSPSPTPAFLAITTDRLFLRQVELADAMSVAALMTPTLAETLCEWRSGMSVGEVTAKIAVHRKAAAAGHRIDWAVFVRPQLAMIGWIGLSRTDGSSTLELDCWLGEVFRGYGYGREAVSAATKRACTEFAADRIETRTCPVNQAGDKFLKRFGIQLASNRASAASRPFATPNARIAERRRDNEAPAKRAVYL